MNGAINGWWSRTMGPRNGKWRRERHSAGAKWLPLWRVTLPRSERAKEWVGKRGLGNAPAGEHVVIQMAVNDPRDASNTRYSSTDVHDGVGGA